MKARLVHSVRVRTLASLLRVLVSILVVVLAAGAASTPAWAEEISVPPVEALAETFPGCNWVCSANDVQIVSMWLGDAAASPITICPASGIIPTAYVWVTLENGTGTDRYYVSLVADLTVGDAPAVQVSPCLISPLLSGPVTQPLQLTQVSNVACSSVITLSNVIVPWNTSGGADATCAGRPGVCNPGWPPGQSWCGGPYTIDVVPGPTPTQVPPTEVPPTEVPPTGVPTLVITAQPEDPTATPVTPTATVQITLAPQDNPTAAPTTAPTATPEPAQPVLPAAGTGGAAGGLGGLVSIAFALAGGAAAWWRRTRI